MHDTDQTRLEIDSEQFDAEWNEEESEVFSEDQVNELAAELLSLSNEAELDHFLGSLIKTAGEAVGKAIKSPIGKQVGGLLKGVAKVALPIGGGMLGSLLMPGPGTMVGRKLGSTLGNAMGLEIDGLSQEDQQFEVAKQFVRLAADTAHKAAKLPPHTNPAAGAKRSLVQAAQKHAPGLVGGGDGPAANGPEQHGRWVRRGRQIILLGL